MILKFSGARPSRATGSTTPYAIGLVAYGVVHLLIGWLAIQLALGDHSESASTKGAMSELAQQPFGEVLVWAVAVGHVPPRRSGGSSRPPSGTATRRVATGSASG